MDMFGKGPALKPPLAGSLPYVACPRDGSPRFAAGLAAGAVFHRCNPLSGLIHHVPGRWGPEDTRGRPGLEWCRYHV